MIRLLLLSCFLLVSLQAKSSIDSQIKTTAASLKNFDRNYASINAKMAKTAKEILKKKKKLLTQQKKIEALEKDLEGKAKVLNTSRAKLQELTAKQEALESSQHALGNDLSELLARALSLTLMQEDNNTLSADAVLGEAILDALQTQTRREIETLGTRYRRNSKTLKSLTGKTAALRNEISEIEQEKKKLVAAQKANKKALKELTAKKRSYKKELQKLLAQKAALKKTLKELHIIQESEAQRSRARQEQRRNEALLASKPLPQVKSVGSSYHKASTRRYRGKKTIPPLDRYTVLKRYGTYTDPIYKIKIFNESVTLKPKSPNAKVKAVFNGKVILAQKTPLLDNVVIIEHSNGLHTIYAHLDRIAPTIKKGKRLKKGSVIGRVNDGLMFEVTQKNYHINPLQVIR